MPPDPNQLAAALAALHGQILEAQDIAPDEALRRQLAGLGATIGEAKTTLVAEYQRAMAEIEQRIAGARSRAEATLQKAQQAKARLADAAATRKLLAPPASPEPPNPEVDPQLGMKLRAELLQRFGDGKKTDRS